MEKKTDGRPEIEQTQNSPVSQFFATYFNDAFMVDRFQTMSI